MTRWLRFLRHYGPIPRNDNMYDETIQRSARRQGMVPIQFEHPHHSRVLECFSFSNGKLSSVVLTGTAGDGKTHLCREVWETLGGTNSEWASDDPHLTLHVHHEGHGGRLRLHFIRDLSGWAPQQGVTWDPARALLLQAFSRSLFQEVPSDVFLIAGNDGQLLETWRRLPQNDDVERARRVFEELLVEDRQELPGINLKLFNLSRTNSAELFDRAIDGLLNHSGWSESEGDSSDQSDFFGPKCPVRHNYELLQTALVQSRLRALFRLSDHNGLHLPIRQVLLLLANAVLGHPDAKDHLMRPQDVSKIIADGTVSKASLYDNVFGGNLPTARRQAITIFDTFERFQIGYETSNRVDNIVIFGEGDEFIGEHFDALIGRDQFYGGDNRFHAARRAYVEGDGEGPDAASQFLQMLVSQRRGLFFKIPQDKESDLGLWDLTVFRFAGEYLDSVVAALQQGSSVRRPIIGRLVRGLNRTFTGMLVNSDRELCVATAGNYSQAKVSRILLDRISVEPSKGERVVIQLNETGTQILLSVVLSATIGVDLPLTLVRYEFLSRIAEEGALPASFSKECYEDLLAFKSQLVAAYLERKAAEDEDPGDEINLKILTLTDQGMPDTKVVVMAK